MGGPGWGRGGRGSGFRDCTDSTVFSVTLGLQGGEGGGGAQGSETAWTHDSTVPVHLLGSADNKVQARQRGKRRQRLQFGLLRVFD